MAIYHWLGSEVKEIVAHREDERGEWFDCRFEVSPFYQGKDDGIETLHISELKADGGYREILKAIEELQQK